MLIMQSGTNGIDICDDSEEWKMFNNACEKIMNDNPEIKDNPFNEIFKRFIYKTIVKAPVMPDIKPMNDINFEFQYPNFTKDYFNE
jgi:hypothetical protein